MRPYFIIRVSERCYCCSGAPVNTHIRSMLIIPRNPSMVTRSAFPLPATGFHASPCPTYDKHLFGMIGQNRVLGV